MRGNRKGYRIAFPADWLNQPFDLTGFEKRSNTDALQASPARTASEAITQTLRPYVGEVPITSKLASKLCGKSHRGLLRLLEKEDLTLGTIINGLKHEYAIEQLCNTNRSVLQISQALGYSDPTSFSRSFRKHAGMSPGKFRREHKGAGAADMKHPPEKDESQIKQTGNPPIQVSRSTL